MKSDIFDEAWNSQNATSFGDAEKIITAIQSHIIIEVALSRIKMLMVNVIIMTRVLSYRTGGCVRNIGKCSDRAFAYEARRKQLRCVEYATVSRRNG